MTSIQRGPSEPVTGKTAASRRSHTTHPVVNHCRPLIDSPPDAGFAKPHVDALVDALAEITGISANDDLGNTLGVTLDSGIALSPVQAAKCLQDLMRTHTFLWSVTRAIRDQLKLKNRIEILYAGTGPYGLLLLPVLACLADDRIQATLIDYHPENIQAVEQVMESLGIRSCIRSIEQADATLWQPPEGMKFDIILSETMNWMLKNEPQVLIFSHLVQYLRDTQSTLIPQQVILDACLHNAGQHHEYRQGLRTKPTETELGIFARLNHESATAIAAGQLTVLDGRIAIPAPLPSDHDTLKLRTEIQVYKAAWLRDGQSSLTIPLCFDSRHFRPGDSLDLTYIYGAAAKGSPPGFDIHFPDRPAVAEAPVTGEALGSLGIRHLKRLWHKAQLEKAGQLDPDIRKKEWPLELALIDLLGVGLEECTRFLFQEAKDFAKFEQWLLDRNDGCISEDRVREINSHISRSTASTPVPHRSRTYLNAEQQSFWQQNGYLVVEDILDKVQCRASVDRIYRCLEKSPDRPDSWYQHHPAQQNIMVQLFRDPILDANRRSEKARRVFTDLWQTEQLRCSTDRVGFNPPETDNYRFTGTPLHWDIDFSSPLVFGTQGLIYLTDVAENQGAFRCVPGFHLILEQWISRLPPGDDPNQQDLSTLEVRHLAAPAGSLIVWHPFLPHGASPNHAGSPRIVQYLNMSP